MIYSIYKKKLAIAPNTGTRGATNALLVSLEKGCESATRKSTVCSGALFKPAIWESVAANPESQASTSRAKTCATTASAACILLAKSQTATLKGARKYTCSILIYKEVHFTLVSSTCALSSSCSFSKRRGQHTLAHPPCPGHTHAAPRSAIPFYPTSKHGSWARHCKPHMPNPRNDAHSQAGCRSPPRSCASAWAPATVPPGTQAKTLMWGIPRGNPLPQSSWVFEPSGNTHHLSPTPLTHYTFL